MKKIIEIEGMSCSHCVKAVEMELKELNPESISVEIGKAEVNYNPEKIGFDEIKNAISEAGFSVKE